MKMITAALLSLFALSTLACPDISGRYSCTDSSSLNGLPVTYEMTVSVQGQTFSLTTVDGTDVFVADNVARSVDGATMTASCNSSLLFIEMNGSEADESGIEMSFDMQSALAKSATGFTVETEMTVSIPAYGVNESTTTMTACNAL